MPKVAKQSVRNDKDRLRLLKALAEGIRDTMDCICDEDGDTPDVGEPGFFMHAYEQVSYNKLGDMREGCFHCMAKDALR